MTPCAPEAMILWKANLRIHQLKMIDTLRLYKEVEVCQVVVFFVVGVFMCVYTDVLFSRIHRSRSACMGSPSQEILYDPESGYWWSFWRTGFGMFCRSQWHPILVTPTNRPIRISANLIYLENCHSHLAIFGSVHGVITRSSTNFIHYSQAFFWFCWLL